MKLRAVIFLSLAWAICQHAKADRVTVHGTNLDLQIHTDQDKKDQLLEFLTSRVLSILPLDVIEKLSHQKIRILFEPGDADQSDGLFTAGERPESAPDEGASTLYIRIKSDLLSSPDLQPLLAHELFHAIHYAIHPNEEPWVREGLAQLFEFLVFKKFRGAHVAAAFARPSTPLRGHYDPRKIVPEQYGHDLLYFYYLWSQCGPSGVGDELFWSIARGEPERFDADGITAALAAARASDPSLSSKPQCKDFESSAIDFEIARIQNQSSWSGENRERYLLWTTTLPGAKPLTAVSEAALKTLGPITPLVALSTARAKIDPASGIKSYWLHRQFPYEVRQDAPDKPDDSWWRLFIRL